MPCSLLPLSGDLFDPAAEAIVDNLLICATVHFLGTGRKRQRDSPKISSWSTTPREETAMLRDDNGNGGGRPSTPRNVLGERLEVFDGRKWSSGERLALEVALGIGKGLTSIREIRRRAHNAVAEAGSIEAAIKKLARERARSHKEITNER
jgi:hypothetical protein